jgi:dTDP-4-dehydrorhamnose reductase
MTARFKVAILGSTGMLGSMVRRFLSSQPEYDLRTYSRSALEAALINVADLFQLISGQDYVINCIGVIKPRIDEKNPASVRDAIQVNAQFPYTLAHAAEWAKVRVLQIATDCVYSGREGNYREDSLHDATDIYGKTKSLGEVVSPAVRHLRCSIIGPEPAGRPRDSLLEWFLGQPKGAQVKGFTNHYWNGITTLAFAKLCHGIMREGIELPPLLHIVPQKTASKAGLLDQFRYSFSRMDITVDEVAAPTAINRTLSTCCPIANIHLWKAAGYPYQPTIQQMVHELVAYEKVVAR